MSQIDIGTTLNIRPTPNVSRHDHALPVRRPTATIAPDCRHYRGDRPCEHNRLCRGCSHYSPYAQRVCVIKLGALGDVIRTLSILPELRDRYPDAHVTWVTRPNACRMIDGHRLIDRLLPMNHLTTLVLPQERFDTVINLDKEPEPCALAMAIFAKKKLGIGLSDHGTPVPLNDQAIDYFHLGLSDDLKFNHNRKSYPRLIHEALGMTYRGQAYEIPLDPSVSRQEQTRLAAKGWDQAAPTLGINVGAADTFANKMWTPRKISDTIVATQEDHPQLQVLLLGGPTEREAINQITARLRRQGHHAPVIDTGTDNSERSFVALVDCCDVLFTGDTMAMHVGIARRKGLVVFFGPTCEQEVELFGPGEKLVAKVPCGPCYKRVCDQNDACLRQISTDDAAGAIGRVMRQVLPAFAAGTEPVRKAG